MILSYLKVHQLRNILSAQVPLNARFNFILGSNGSGKTSILEALYLLSCGRSFRIREIAPIVSFNQQQLTVFARAVDGSTVSIQKSNSSATHIKLNDQFCSATSQLAYALPCQIVYADIFQIIDAGSAERRAVLDWGLFHVKPNYLTVWKDYKKVLKQRNALLKQNVSYEQFIPWDKQLSVLAAQLDELREEYFLSLNASFQRILANLTTVSCTIRYFKGWDKKAHGASLLEVLAEHFYSDKQRQYTQYGAHHADIIIESNDNRAKQSLSRGQQKIILIALKLAQGALLERNCLYLFDDLPSELDGVHQENLINYLKLHRGQYVITATFKMNGESLIDVEQQSSFLIDAGSIHKL